MPEDEFMVHFDKCPICGETETLTQKAWAHQIKKGKISESQAEIPLHFSLEGVPVVDPSKGVGISIDVLLAHFEICFGCGHKYVRWAEIKTQPVQMKPPSSQQGQNPFGFLPRG